MAAKGICSVCSENVTLRLDGLVRAHGYLKTGEKGPRTTCAGSDQSPRQDSSDGAFSALCMLSGCEQRTRAIVWTENSWMSLCASHGIKRLK